MANIVTRNQPQGLLQINWSNPITQGLSFAYAPQGLALQGFSTSGTALIPFGGAVSNINALGQGGRVVGASGNLGSINSNMTTGSYSLFSLQTVDSVGVNGQMLDDDVVGTARNFQFRIDSGAVTIIPFSGSSAFSVTQPNAVTAAQATAGFSAGAVVSGTSFANWQAGRKVSGTSTGTLNAPSGNTLVGNFKSGGGNPFSNGAIFLVAGWNRALSDAEMASLAANPWQLFKTTQLSFATPVAAAISAAMYTAGISESGTLGETISTGAAAIMVSMAEASSAVDADTALAIYLASNPEVGSALEVLSSSAMFVSTTSDSRAVADNVSSIAAIAATLIESGTSADLLSAYAAFVANANESGTAADITLLLGAGSVSNSDTLSSSEVASNSAVFVSSTVDSGAANDNTGLLAATSAANSDILAGLESVLSSVSAITALSDTLAVNDTVAGVSSLISTIAEAVAAIESEAAVSGIMVVSSDVLTSADNTLVALIASLTILDNLSSSDNYTAQLSAISSTLEALNVLESLTSVGGNTLVAINHLRLFAIKANKRISTKLANGRISGV